MKIIDRYILRSFFGTAVFALLSFVIIFVVVDMMENLDDFLDAHASTQIIAVYYLAFMPEIIKLMIPVALLFSSMFTTGRLNSYSELTAMKCGGMSLYRFMLPFVAASLVISIGAVYFNGWIVPKANAKKFAIEREYLNKSLSNDRTTNVFFQAGKNRLCSIGSLDEPTNIATQVSIEDFSPQERTKLIRRYDARTMLWDDSTKSWTLNDGVLRTFSSHKQKLEQFSKKNIGNLSLTPEDIRKKQEKPDEMNYDDLAAFIENQRSLGNDVSRWSVDYYGKIAFPFAGVVVVLFGVPFSSIKRKSGLGVEFGIAVAVCFLYMVFLKVSQVFGYNGDLNPLLTAWMANIIFFSLAIINLIRVPK